MSNPGEFGDELGEFIFSTINRRVDVFEIFGKAYEKYDIRPQRDSFIDLWKGSSRIRICALFDSLHEITAGCYSLLVLGQVSEAKILLRSLIEGHLVIYGIFRSPEGFEVSSAEYCDELFEAYMANEASYVENATNILDRSSAVNFVKLGRDSTPLNDLLGEAKRNFSASARKKLIRKWSGGTLLQRLEGNGLTAGEVRMLRLLWGANSHLAHVDPCSLEIRYWLGSDNRSEWKAHRFVDVINTLAYLLYFAYRRFEVAQSFLCQESDLPAAVRCKEDQDLSEIIFLVQHVQAVKKAASEGMNLDEYLKHATDYGDKWVQGRD